MLLLKITQLSRHLVVLCSQLFVFESIVLLAPQLVLVGAMCSVRSFFSRAAGSGQILQLGLERAVLFL